MSNLRNIQKSVSDYFGKMVVPVEKLRDSGGSKTVRKAKAVAVYIARSDGHSNDDIAKEFGYKNPKSVSNVFSKVSKNIKSDKKLYRDAKAIAERLSIEL